MTEADLFNAPTPIEFEGRTFLVPKPNGLQRGEFQRWLEKRAYDAIERRAYRAGRESQRETDRNNLTKDEAAGVYAWGSEASIAAIRGLEGSAKFMEIMLRDQGMNLEMAERFVERKLAEAAAVLMSKVTADPKSLGAVLSKLGLPENFLSSDSLTHPSNSDSTTSAPSATTSSPVSTA